MSDEKIKKTAAGRDSSPSPATGARKILRRALKGALATLDRQTGHPYASLVTVALDPGGTPLLLISKLALHTQNATADPRASLLAEELADASDPLAVGRVTVIGRLAPVESETARRRFLERHPAAAIYSAFPDFSMFALTPERAHYVGGFGRIADIPPGDLLLDLGGAEALLAAEAEIVAHMNEDHGSAVALYATELCAAPSGPWRMTGIDPEGCDLVCDDRACRVAFAHRITSPAEARRELVRLADEARAGAQAP